MLTCSNCSNEALYKYRVTGTYSMPFCVPCLPGFLKSKQYAGRVVKVAQEEVTVEEAPKPAPKKRTTKKKATKPVEEPVVEEPVVEDATEEVVAEDGTD